MGCERPVARSSGADAGIKIKFLARTIVVWRSRPTKSGPPKRKRTYESMRVSQGAPRHIRTTISCLRVFLYRDIDAGEDTHARLVRQCRLTTKAGREIRQSVAWFEFAQRRNMDINSVPMHRKLVAPPSGADVVFSRRSSSIVRTSMQSCHVSIRSL